MSDAPNRCPICGGPVKFHTADEGTSHYESLAVPTEVVEGMRKALLTLHEMTGICDDCWNDGASCDDPCECSCHRPAVIADEGLRLYDEWKGGK